MRQGATKELYGYWSRIKADRSAPTREEIEPSDIRHLLADTFILDISPNLNAVSYRLAGTRLCAAHGCELKGRGFLVPFSEESCCEIVGTIGRTYHEHEPHVLSLTGTTASGRSADYEMILLPLQIMADGSNRVLGISVPHELPFWLGADPLTNWLLRNCRAIDHAGTAGAPALAPELQEPQFTNPYPGFNPSPDLGEGPRRVAHLVVHPGGKSH